LAKRAAKPAPIQALVTVYDVVIARIGETPGRQHLTLRRVMGVDGGGVRSIETA
jgi:hypothetical protein